MLYDRIKDKQIVIFGANHTALDLVGLFEFPRFLYFVEEEFRNNPQKPLAAQPVYPSGKLLEEDKSDLMVIISTHDRQYAADRLTQLGFEEDRHFIYDDALLEEYPPENFQRDKVYVWGTGNYYDQHKVFLDRYIPEFEAHVVTESRGQTEHMGKAVYNFADIKEECRQGLIVICSIYYSEIARTLMESGFRPGVDFISANTFLVVCSYADYRERAQVFDNRQTGGAEMLVVLAGYKPLLWEDVFSRLRAYLPPRIDVVIVTSGLVSQELRDLCAQNGWSYLATAVNNVSLVQNVAITLFPQARYIYKMDEDIFVTKGCFEALRAAAEAAEGECRVGFVTPLIPINGYGYRRLLEATGLLEEWQERFGPPRLTNSYSHHTDIYYNPQAAEFMWSHPRLKDIDALAQELAARPLRYSLCPVRYNIGLIAFPRDIWRQMNKFPCWPYYNMGSDEEYFCVSCMQNAWGIVVAENALVGHFSFAYQYDTMEAYYHAHREQFRCKELPPGQ